MTCSQGQETTSPKSIVLPSDLSQHLSKTCISQLQAYLDWEPRSENRAACDALIQDAANKKAILENSFTKSLEFGTAGLRGRMGPGFNCMNDLTVIGATQGLCLYLLTTFGEDECAKRGVVLGFDGRHNSRRFAHAAAAVFLSKGFRVYLNQEVTATPMNPYAVVKYGCICGVQVTASHNPKDDNGYKVYASNGAQIIPPMDSEVAQNIRENVRPWDRTLALLNESGYLKDESMTINPYHEIFDSYMNDMTQELSTRNEETSKSSLQIVYTAMHGVGSPFVKEILCRFGYPETNLHVVKEQDVPDPEFSTVHFPNPEEKGALDLAMALADRVNSPMVIANDPDADRFAAAEKQRDGSWKIFHGDELGILFGAQAYQAHLAKGVPKDKMLFICSAVSSRMLQKMAETEGARFEETMTGFKWMMNRALDLKEKESYIPCLVYEEALGYALSSSVPDKDGVSAAACWVQFVTGLYDQGINVAEYLQQLRLRYGYFVTNNSYFLCHDKVAITTLFNEFRNGGEYKQALGRFAIKRIRDVTVGYDNGQPDLKSTFPLTPESQMITLFFENGAVLTLRTSGTEPKLKWYSEISGPDPTEAKKELDEVVEATIQHLLQPQKYPLETPGAK